jgi:hypothetical protein
MGLITHKGQGGGLNWIKDGVVTNKEQVLSLKQMLSVKMNHP